MPLEQVDCKTMESRVSVWWVCREKGGEESAAEGAHRQQLALHHHQHNITSCTALQVLPGLFLCGEVLDVFGRIGGFNFWWAWLSGRLAGQGAAAAVALAATGTTEQAGKAA